MRHRQIQIPRYWNLSLENGGTSTIGAHTTNAGAAAVGRLQLVMTIHKVHSELRLSVCYIGSGKKFSIFEFGFVVAWVCFRLVCSTSVEAWCRTERWRCRTEAGERRAVLRRAQCTHTHGQEGKAVNIYGTCWLLYRWDPRFGGLSACAFFAWPPEHKWLLSVNGKALKIEPNIWISKSDCISLRKF